VGGGALAHELGKPARLGPRDKLQGRVRSIGHLPNEDQARLFSDYLVTKGIRNEVEAEDDGTWLIWVLEDAQLEAGRTLLDRFRRFPAAPEFARDAAAADEVRQKEAEDQKQWRRRVFNRRRVFPGMQSYRAGVLTYVLVVACVAVAVFSNLGANDEVLRHLFISFPAEGDGTLFPEVRAGEVWRLLSPMIIHFGLPHIVFNMMWLFQLGSMIESAHGTNRFAVLIAVFALGSNVLQYLFAGPFFGGMSGVNYGLIGYVWIRGRFDPGSGLHLDKPSVVMAIGWFFLCFTGWVGPVANYAHAGGLILGMAWGWVSARWALRNL
jgi:GlpG protein